MSDDRKGDVTEAGQEQRTEHRDPDDQYRGLRPPWPKGTSGNPGGRLKGSLSLVSILRQQLAAGDGEHAKALIKSLLKEAEGGDYQHLREVLDRIDGKVTETHQVTLRVGEAQEGMLDAVERVCIRLNAEHVYLAILDELDGSRSASQG